MSDAIWYYVDRAQQRVGPVTADMLVAAWHSGDASDTSLVWREGLADWRPLAEYRAELGLGPAAPVVSPQPRQAPGPLPPAGQPAGTPPKKSGCLIVGIVITVVMLVLLGVLAALAIPAYNEYMERAREAAEAAGADDDGMLPDDAAGDDDGFDTDDGAGDGSDAADDAAGSPGSASVAAALAEARMHQAQVDEFVANTDRCPRDADELALPPPASRGVQSFTVGVSDTRMCTITLEFGGPEAGAMAGEKIVLSRDGGGDWYCTSDMVDRSELPSDCY